MIDDSMVVRWWMVMVRKSSWPELVGTNGSAVAAVLENENAKVQAAIVEEGKQAGELRFSLWPSPGLGRWKGLCDPSPCNWFDSLITSKSSINLHGITCVWVSSWCYCTLITLYLLNFNFVPWNMGTACNEISLVCPAWHLHGLPVVMYFCSAY